VSHIDDIKLENDVVRIGTVRKRPRSSAANLEDKKEWPERYDGKENLFYTNRGS
jgi:hypothetical protein